MQEFENEGFFEDEDECPEFDALVEFLSNAPPDERVMVTNPAKLMPVEFACMMLQRLARKTEKGATVAFTQQASFDRRSGGAQVELSIFDVDDMKDFGRILEFVDAFEVMALVDGRIRIILTFRNLYVPAE